MENLLVHEVMKENHKLRIKEIVKRHERTSLNR